VLLAVTLVLETRVEFAPAKVVLKLGAWRAGV
jgi:hypothetical protein